MPIAYARNSSGVRGAEATVPLEFEGGLESVASMTPMVTIAMDDYKTQ